MNSHPISSEQLLQQLKWRYAVKKFDPSRTIPADIWAALEESMVLAPSSFGLQPWKFFVITDSQMKERLLPHSWGQRQVVDASHLVVFAINKHINDGYIDRFLARTAEVQGISVESLQKFGDVIKGFAGAGLDLKAWAGKQTYIALGQFMVAAALLGIDTCPMEGLIPEQYDEVLGLKETDYTTIVACPAGYRAEDDKNAFRPKVRFSMEEMIVRI